MKCDKCGYTPNPGDQICLNCGAKLSLNNAILPEVEEIKTEEKKSNKKIITIAIISIIIAIILIFLIIKLFILKD